MPSGYPGTKAPHGSYCRYTRHGCRCPLCRESNRKHYCEYKPSKSAKQHRIEYDKEARHSKKVNRREYIQQLKSVPCKDCGKTFPWYCMDHDHVPERGKREFLISHWVSRQMKWDKLEKELAKCDIICAICHRVRTRKRQFPMEFLPPI